MTVKTLNPLNREYFAVIDTETTWTDKVMSIGVVIADSASFEPVTKMYFIISPECRSGGMYTDALHIIKADLTETRAKVIQQLKASLQRYNIRFIFAYNALFDCKHLPELQNYMWFDIMKLAAYRQYNRKIPECAECCSTGRLKRNYGVEPILRMLSGDHSYHETHNAVCDAVDELTIMKLLGWPLSEYARTQVSKPAKTASFL